MQCQVCGTDNPPNVPVCGACGAGIDSPSGPATGATGPQPGTPQPGQGYAAPGYDPAGYDPAGYGTTPGYAAGPGYATATPGHGAQQPGHDPSGYGPTGYGGTPGYGPTGYGGTPGYGPTGYGGTPGHGWPGSPPASTGPVPSAGGYPAASGPPGPWPPGEAPPGIPELHGRYRARVMRHEPPDELASSQVTFRVLRPHLFRFVVFLVLENVLFVLWLIFSLMSAIGRLGSGGNGFGNSGGGFFGFVSALLGIAMLLVALAWLVSLFLPTREPIAEYGVLLEERAAGAGQAFGWIAYTVQRRGTPLQVGDASSSGHHLLTLSSRTEKGAVLVTGYGSDLYLGWTMWRRRSTVRVIIDAVRDMLETLRGGAYAADVRLGETRAFRELIHSVTREGVQVAIENSGTAGPGGGSGRP